MFYFSHGLIRLVPMHRGVIVTPMFYGVMIILYLTHLYYNVVNFAVVSFALLFPFLEFKPGLSPCVIVKRWDQSSRTFTEQYDDFLPYIQRPAVFCRQQCRSF
jgi:hypothetical protein